MKINKGIIAVLMILFVSLNLTGCTKYVQNKGEEHISIYIGVKDQWSLNLIKVIIDSYKKSNPDVKVTVNSVQSDASGENDILLIPKTDMMSLVHKGVLADMDNFYKQNNVASRYYSVFKSYGRFNDKYYGIPVLPYSFEFLYNKGVFYKLKIKPPSDTKEFNEMMRKFNSMSQKIPVVLNEDMDINNMIFLINENRASNDMQSVFKNINDMVKSGIITKNTFSIGNDTIIDKLNRGGVPMAVIPSCRIGDLNDYDVGSIDQKILGIPIVSDVVLCTPVTSNNSQEVEEFMKFILGDEIQAELLKKGYVTANRRVNSGSKGIKKQIASYMDEKTENNISVENNFSQSVKSNISVKIDEIFSGKYTGNEWKEILETEQR